MVQFLFRSIAAFVITGSISLPTASAQGAPSGSTKYVDKWCDALEKGSLKERRRAVLILASASRVESAIPFLTKALKDTDDVVRIQAAQALGRMGENAKAAVPALIENLNDKESMVSSWSAYALGQINSEPEKTVAALVQRIADQDEDVASAAAWSLGAFALRAKKAVPTLIEALKHESVLVRVNAAQALLRIDQHEAGLKILIDSLTNKDAFISSFAAEAIAQNRVHVKGPAIRRGVTAFTQTLRHEDLETRQWALYGLGEFGAEAKSAVPAILEALKEQTLNREYVLIVLQKIDPEIARSVGGK